MFLMTQLIGFLLLLMAFASMMLLGLPNGSRVNLVLNLIDACLLAVDALANRRWAFFALECVWALVALYAIIRLYLKRDSFTTKNCSSATRQEQGICIQPIEAELTVCKVADYTEIELNSPYVFTGRTDQEASLVCPTEIVPSRTLERSDGWRAFHIQGILDFSLIGILAPIATILANKGIGIFAVSTYNTDYVLTKAEDFPAALDALDKSGYTIIFLTHNNINHDRRCCPCINKHPSSLNILQRILRFCRPCLSSNSMCFTCTWSISK